MQTLVVNRLIIRKLSEDGWQDLNRFGLISTSMLYKSNGALHNK